MERKDFNLLFLKPKKVSWAILHGLYILSETWPSHSTPSEHMLECPSLISQGSAAYPATLSRCPAPFTIFIRLFLIMLTCNLPGPPLWLWLHTVCSTPSVQNDLFQAQIRPWHSNIHHLPVIPFLSQSQCYILTMGLRSLYQRSTHKQDMNRKYRYLKHVVSKLHHSQLYLFLKPSFFFFKKRFPNDFFLWHYHGEFEHTLTGIKWHVELCGHTNPHLLTIDLPLLLKSTHFYCTVSLGIKVQISSPLAPFIKVEDGKCKYKFKIIK